VQVARDGKPMPVGAVFVLEHMRPSSTPSASRSPAPTATTWPNRFVGFAVMGTGHGWGEAFRRCCATATGTTPGSPGHEAARGVNQAECLACHKPLDEASFLFSLEPLTMVAKAR
jgi:hypothetical protein